MRHAVPWLLVLSLPLRAQEPPPPVPSAESLQQEFDQALRAWTDQNNKAHAANDEKEMERLRGQRPEKALR